MTITRREELAWAAGIIDGEGYFGSKKPLKPHYCPGVTFEIAQSSDADQPAIFDRLKEIFPLGRINGPYYHGRRRPIWRFRTEGIENVQHILASTWIWLGDIKRQQAVNALSPALEQWKGMGGGWDRMGRRPRK